MGGFIYDNFIKNPESAGICILDSKDISISHNTIELYTATDCLRFSKGTSRETHNILFNELENKCYIGTNLTESTNIRSIIPVIFA